MICTIEPEIAVTVKEEPKTKTPTTSTPVQTTKQTTPMKPVETTKPAKTTKLVKTAKPAEPTKTAETPKLAPAPTGSTSKVLIKGNINSKGEKIYHMPNGAIYDRTIIDESKGERWFHTEAEAQAAGWRRFQH